MESSSSSFVWLFLFLAILLLEYVVIVGGHYAYLSWFRPTWADLFEGHMYTNEQHKYAIEPPPPHYPPY